MKYKIALVVLSLFVVGLVTIICLQKNPAPAKFYSMLSGDLKTSYGIAYTPEMEAAGKKILLELPEELQGKETPLYSYDQPTKPILIWYGKTVRSIADSK